MSTIQADQLSDAIKESNIEEVQSLLSELNPTHQQLIKYLDTAEKVILTRQIQLNPNIAVSIPYSFINSWVPGVICLGGMTSCLALADYYEKCKCNNQKTGICAIASLAFGAAFFINAIRFLRYNVQIRLELHKNAITIKETLYDYSEFSK